MRKVASTLIAIVLILLSLGVVMLASTSSVRAASRFGDPYFFLKRQVVWLLISFVAGTAVIYFDYHWWRKFAAPLTALAIILLVLVLVPGIGAKIGGSNRWLRLGPLSLQPSELAKFSVVVGLASWMSRIGSRARKFKEGLLLPALGLSMALCLLIAEPDFGTTMLVGMVGMSMMFVGGTRLSYLLMAGATGLCGFIVALMFDHVRMLRILAFLMPEKYPAAAYHLAQSRIAFMQGGLFGVGLGNSIQKQFYLPEAHTDFILAIIGEELGFIATGAVAMLFMGLLACGMIIAFRGPDPLARLLGFGITTTIVLQTVINIGVVTGCLPTKGLPLPFISYGGSNMIMSVVSTCVLLNIARHADSGYADNHTHPIKDLWHR